MSQPGSKTDVQQRPSATDPQVSTLGSAKPAIVGENAWLAEAMLGNDRSRLPDVATQFLRTCYLPLLAGTLFGLGVGALAGWAAFGVILFAAATAVDVAGRHVKARHEMILSRAGASPIVRSLARSLLAVILLAQSITGPSGTVFFAYLVVVAAVQLSWFATLIGVRWLAPKQPMLLYRPGGPQPQASLRYAKARARARDIPIVPLAVELLALIVLLAALAFPAAVVPAALVVALGVLGLLAMTALRTLEIRRLAQGAEKAQTDLAAQLAEADPTVLIYMTGGVGQSKYILNQWMPAFARMQQPAIVVVREASQLPFIVDAGIPVVYAPRTRHVEGLVLASVQVAFYPANAGKNVHLWREAGIKHVFLNHGDSDKSTSANPVVRAYDEVWGAGQAAAERYAAAGVDLTGKFAIVGRPQVESLTVGPLGHARTTLLYAPTFEGYYEESNYSSLERMGPAMIAALLDHHPEVRIWFKPHPASGVQRPGMKAAQAEIVQLLRSAPASHGHLCVDDRPELTLLDCFAQADVLVSDISSVVTDFLYTERPLIVTNPRQLPVPDFEATFPTQRSSYLLEQDLSNFDTVFADAFGADPMADERREMKLYVLGDLPEGPMAAFTQNTARIIADAKRDRALITNEFRVRTGPSDAATTREQTLDGDDSDQAVEE